MGAAHAAPTEKRDPKENDMYQVIFTFENGATPVTATAAPGEKKPLNELLKDE